MWKFTDFSNTEILRDTNYCEFRVAKNATYFFLGSECWICKISALKNGKKSPISEFPNSIWAHKFYYNWFHVKIPVAEKFLFFHAVISEPFVMGNCVMFEKLQYDVQILTKQIQSFDIKYVTK